MGGMSSPGQRALAELARDPQRTDALIALAAACTDRTVLRTRRVLERRGVIAPVPRLQRTDYRPSRNPGAYQRALAQLAADPSRSNRAIAALARCSDQTVLAARRAAAARDQGHTAGMGKVYEPPGSIEDACPMCTLEYRDGRWQHGRGCILG